jgi:hypothetical protein
MVRIVTETESMSIVLKSLHALENTTAWMAHVDIITNDDLAFS